MREETYFQKDAHSKTCIDLAFGETAPIDKTTSLCSSEINEHTWPKEGKTTYLQRAKTSFNKVQKSHLMLDP